jgi:hypothetical protein
MAAARLSELPHIPVANPASETGVLPVIAMYGANASGKTNVLRGLQFMARAVAQSQTVWTPDQPIPRQAFAFDDDSKSASSLFEVFVALDGNTYQYGFELNDQRVESEWLFTFPNVKRQLLFERKTETYRFGKNLTGENKAIQSLTRPNSLFLSAAAQNNHKVLTPLYQWFTQRVVVLRGDRSELTDRTAQLLRGESVKKFVASVMKLADLGVQSVDLEELEPDVRIKKLADLLKTLPLEDSVAFEDPGKILKVYTQHRGTRTDLVRLALEEESRGTIAVFGLLGPFLHAVVNGHVLCVDELDASLHPILAKSLIRIFYHGLEQKPGAQLIFNTHDTNLLDTTLLRRDQIYFAEKNEKGATAIYPLTDFRPRKNENLESGYLQGRCGAIPFVSERPLEFVDIEP